MTPLEIFQEARLTEALSVQLEVVSNRPDDAAERLLLCDLLGFAGKRSVIREHLSILVNGPEAIQAYLAEWNSLLQAEEARESLEVPEFLIEPPQTAMIRSRAIRAKDDVTELIDEADDGDTWPSGHVDGREFAGWRDCDELLGNMLEVFADGRYVWVPIEQVRKLRFDEGESLRDSLYRPATITLTNRRVYEVFLPTLYVGTHTHSEDGIRTGAGVDFYESFGLTRGCGEHTFLVGEEELGISEIRQVEIRRV